MNGAPRDGGPRSATVGQRLSARLHKARPALPQPTYLVRRKHRNEHVVTQQRHRAKRRAAVDESKPESIHRYLEGGQQPHGGGSWSIQTRKFAIAWECTHHVHMATHAPPRRSSDTAPCRRRCCPAYTRRRARSAWRRPSRSGSWGASEGLALTCRVGSHEFILIFGPFVSVLPEYDGEDEVRGDVWELLHALGIVARAEDSVPCHLQPRARWATRGGRL